MERRGANAADGARRSPHGGTVVSAEVCLAAIGRFPPITSIAVGIFIESNVRVMNVNNIR